MCLLCQPYYHHHRHRYHQAVVEDVHRYYDHEHFPLRDSEHLKAIINMFILAAITFTKNGIHQ